MLKLNLKIFFIDFAATIQMIRHTFCTFMCHSFSHVSMVKMVTFLDNKTLIICKILELKPEKHLKIDKNI